MYGVSVCCFCCCCCCCCSCEVSPFYATCGSASDTVRQAVAGPLRREALLGEGEAAAAAKQFYKTIAADDANAKFTSEIFWLTIRAVRLCFKSDDILLLLLLLFLLLLFLLLLHLLLLLLLLHLLLLLRCTLGPDVTLHGDRPETVHACCCASDIMQQQQQQEQKQ